MTLRYVASGGLGFLVTLGIILLMQSLIATGPARLRDFKGGRIVDFVRLKREAQTEVKKRELPNKKQDEDQPPAPDLDLSDVPKLTNAPAAALAPALEPSLDLVGGPQLGAAASDTDVIPLVRVSPQYPPDAMMKGIEGWVHVEFTITAAGTVKDAKVVDADPKGFFERAAVNAVNRYKYKPKSENGTAVERAGVELVITFRLKKPS